MAKKKKELSPRRKRMMRDARLQSAKAWLKEFDGKNVIKSYSNWYAVDKTCALKELELLGLRFSEKEKKAVQQSYENRVAQTQRLKEKRMQEAYEQELFFEGDERLAFIAGFTEGGAPYGLTHEEMEVLGETERWQSLD